MCIKRIVAREIVRFAGLQPSHKLESIVRDLLRFPAVSKHVFPKDKFLLTKRHLQLAAEFYDRHPGSDTEAHSIHSTPSDAFSTTTVSESVCISESDDRILTTVDPVHLTDAILLSPRLRAPAIHGDFSCDDTSSESVYRSSFLPNQSRYRTSREDEIIEQPPAQKIVIEFSSPNIAKPFHVGHLRSTILGNALANLYKVQGHSVVKINYLGDWGTQFGLLILGFLKFGSHDALNRDPVQHLFEVYVKINQAVSSEMKDGREDSTYKDALNIVAALENGDDKYVGLWKLFKDLTLPHLHSIYERLDIQFDVEDCESMYVTDARNLSPVLHNQTMSRLGSVAGCDKQQETHFSTDIPQLLRSDGTSLYLSRDLAALLDRKERTAFDRIHYVVEMGQHEHFRSLLDIADRMGCELINSCRDDFHVMFGRVHGMSTRKGDVVLLTDLLDQGKRQMVENMTNKKSTKVLGSLDDTADILSISSVIIQDLSERRMKQYKFSWKTALNFEAESGVFLQYCHARLCSLIENCGVIHSDSVDSSLLLESESQKLILHIARFDDVLRDSLFYLEPCILVRYLFTLAHLTNSGLKTLRVKGETLPQAQARLRLFYCSRKILHDGLRILGITPLAKM